MQISFNWHTEGLHSYSEGAEDIIPKAENRLVCNVCREKAGFLCIGYKQVYVTVAIADSEGTSPK